MVDKHLTNARALLETLMSELRIGEAQPELWEALHAAAVRDGKEHDLAEAYRKIATDRRLRQLSAAVYGQVVMHAANFSQGVLGDVEGAERFLRYVLEVAPENREAFHRLERKFEAAGDRLRLVELYALVAATPPKQPDELARRALKIIALLPAKTPVSDDGCKRLLALVPASPAILSVLEEHCRKTHRYALACELLERAIEEHALPEMRIIEQHRRLIDLYMGEAKAPEKAISHVEELLQRDANDAQARTAAERLTSNREVASRAAAALQHARRRGRAPRA